MPQPFQFFTPGSIDFGEQFLKGQRAAREEEAQTAALETRDLQNIALQQQISANQRQETQDIGGQQLRNLQNQLGIDDARTNALFNDAVTAKALLGISPQRAASFIGNRASIVQQSGGDPQDTLEVANLIQSGDIEGANSLLDSVIRAGKQSGILATDKKDSPFQRGEGGLVFNPNDGTYTLSSVANERINELNQKKSTPQGLGVKEIQSLNKDITGFTKSAVAIKSTANDLEKLSKIGTGPAAIAAVFKFMKANDPTSTVREGEFATAEQSAGIPAQITNFYNKMISGERIDESQIKQFVDTSKVLANSAIDSSKSVVDGYLNTFGDTLQPRFVGSVIKRIPKPFDINAATTTTSPAGATSQIGRFTVEAL